MVFRPTCTSSSITSAGTALITAYETTTTNLSPLRGPAKAPSTACHAQEIDLATGKVLFDWNSLSHVAVDRELPGLTQRESKGTPVDYFHINSVQELQNGNLLISARNTWALYEVDRSTGKIVWRLNGKRSDFTMGAGQPFLLAAPRSTACQRPVHRFRRRLIASGGETVSWPAAARGR